jgi:hypothetical protein
MSTYDFIEPAAIKHSLPRSGPFSLSPAWVRREWLGALGWVLLMLALGGFMAAFGVYQVQGGLRASSIWDNGVPAADGASYNGEVTVHNFIGRSYELEVFAQTAEGQPLRFEASFFRWFTGPDDGDPVSVRYLAEDPTEAVLSWQAESSWHQYVSALLMFAIASVFGLGGWAIVGTSRGTVREAREQARSGRLVSAPVIDRSQRADDKQKTIYSIRWEVPGGPSGRHEWKKERESPLLLDGGAQVVVLVSDEMGTARSLWTNGWPIRL